MEIQQAAVAHPQLEEMSQFDLWERLALSLPHAEGRRALMAAPHEHLAAWTVLQLRNTDPPFGTAAPRASRTMCPRVSYFRVEFFCQSHLVVFMQSHPVK